MTRKPHSTRMCSEVEPQRESRHRADDRQTTERSRPRHRDRQEQHEPLQEAGEYRAGTERADAASARRPSRPGPMSPNTPSSAVETAIQTTWNATTTPHASVQPSPAYSGPTYGAEASTASTRNGATAATPSRPARPRQPVSVSRAGGHLNERAAQALAVETGREQHHQRLPPGHRQRHRGQRAQRLRSAVPAGQPPIAASIAAVTASWPTSAPTAHSDASASGTSPITPKYVAPAAQSARSLPGNVLRTPRRQPAQPAHRAARLRSPGPGRLA